MWQRDVIHRAYLWSIEKLILLIFEFFLDNYSTFVNVFLHLRTFLLQITTTALNVWLSLCSDIIVVSFFCYINVVARVSLGIVTHTCIAVIALCILTKAYVCFRRRLDDTSYLSMKCLNLCL